MFFSCFWSCFLALRQNDSGCNCRPWAAWLLRPGFSSPGWASRYLFSALRCRRCSRFGSCWPFCFFSCWPVCALRQDRCAPTIFWRSSFSTCWPSRHFISSPPFCAPWIFPSANFALNPDYLGLLALLIGLHVFPLLAAGRFLKPVSWRRAWPIVLLQVGVADFLCQRFCASALFSLFLLALLFIVFLLCRRRFWPRHPAVAAAGPVDQSLAGPLFAAGKTGIYQRQPEKYFCQPEPLRQAGGPGDRLRDQFPESASFIRSSTAGQPRRTGRHAGKTRWRPGKHRFRASTWLPETANCSIRFPTRSPISPLNKKDIFPFWHVENVDADLFGKKVSLAVATINVFQKERYLGYIMVQVLNSAELILKQPRAAVHLRPGPENRRRRHRLSSSWTSTGASWKIRPTSTWKTWPRCCKPATPGSPSAPWGSPYRGYVFKSDDETIIIFYPENTFFKSFSEFIKILVFLLLLAALFNLRRLKKFQWRSVFQSFSHQGFRHPGPAFHAHGGRVFAVFPEFQFPGRWKRSCNQAIYRRGRSALNIINNLLAESGEITQNHMFLLEKILENDISVYENGMLLYTSNHRKIIRSQLPIYLNSGIRDLLQQNNQQFDLQKNGEFPGPCFSRPAGIIFLTLNFPSTAPI